MPVWLVPLLIRYVLPAVLSAARKAGLINLVEEELIKFGMSIKTYHEPTDFPSVPPATMTPNNLQPQRVK